MTLDFLSSGPVDDEFIKYFEEKEKIFFQTADKFRKAKVW